jgi:hypothetical protein
MRVLIGVMFLIAGVAGLLVARPRHGRPRSFVGTNLEVPAVLLILGAIAVGMVLSISGIAAWRQE